MVDWHSTVSVIILTLYILKYSKAKQSSNNKNGSRLSDWIKNETQLRMSYLQEICFKYKDTDDLKVKGWDEIHHTDTRHKNAGVG